MTTERPIEYDVITIGRTCADLYADQVGCRMEEARSFSKYVGGSPTNIAVGAARLGLKAALMSRVGDDQMGRFVLETLEAEGVDTRAVAVDPDRLTAMVFLGIENDRRFPLMFVRTDCADAALTEADVDPDFVRSARAIVVTGTHFSQPHLAAASFKAMSIAREAGRRVVLDIDYRPNLWGLGGAGDGDVRFVADADVTARVQRILPACDLIVGTEEEVHLAGGTTDTHAALAAMRALTDAMIVLKTGPKGCLVFPGDIPADLAAGGISAEGFPVEVFNVLGAGDGFLAGFLSAYLRDAPLDQCCRVANACGALAVSRHGCAPSYPSLEELEFFLARGIVTPRLRDDPELDHVHWTTTARRGDWQDLCVLAIDHRAQLETMAAEAGADPVRLSRFKALALEVVLASRQPGRQLGVLLDGKHGRDALFCAQGEGLWIGRPVERPGSRPLTFEGAPSLGVELATWPSEHVVKCLVRFDPDDPESLRREQIAQLRRLAFAARATRHECLIEVVGTGASGAGECATAGAMALIYDEGIRPDWWKLPDQTDAGWAAVDDVIARTDRFCRGVLLLGFDASMDVLADALGRARRASSVRGFAVGRTIFADAAKAWLAGRIDDAEAGAMMTERFEALIGAWHGGIR